MAVTDRSKNMTPNVQQDLGSFILTEAGEDRGVSRSVYRRSWPTLLLRIPDVPGYFGPQTGYTD
jgi:hypothetical protein